MIFALLLMHYHSQVTQFYGQKIYLKMKTLFNKKVDKIRDYLDYVERHYRNVQTSAELFKEKIDISEYLPSNSIEVFNQNIINHDLSKLGVNEFIQYQQYFYNVVGEEKDKDLFLKAWEHHYNNNKHHWNYWEGKIMPITYIFEMIIDWMAMGIEFNDDALIYYENNKHKMDLHPKTKEMVEHLLHKIYEH